MEVGVTVWQPVGWGESSFGHISTDVNGTTYSFGLAGMTIIPTGEYNEKNSFRNGLAILLKINEEQELSLQNCLATSNDKYNFINNNCGTPVQKCLGELGINTENQIMPVSLGNKLIDMGIKKGHKDYPATQNANGSSAPWAR